MNSSGRKRVLRGRIERGEYVPKTPIMKLAVAKPAAGLLQRSKSYRKDLTEAFISDVVRGPRGCRVVAEGGSLADLLIGKNAKQPPRFQSRVFAGRLPFRRGRSVKGPSTLERALRTLGYAINGRLLPKPKKAVLKAAVKSALPRI